MPKRTTIFLTDHYYHIYNRGVNRQRIFFNEENYKYLKRLFKRNVLKYNVDFVAYCLMPNHFHLLVKPNEDHNISEFIQSTFSSYSQAINNQQRRHGHVFQGRFRSIQIKQETNLIHLARYIHINPVSAGFIADPINWKYSNYHDVISHRNTILKDNTLVPTCFSSGSKYRQFVEDYLYDVVEITDNFRKHILDLE